MKNILKKLFCLFLLLALASCSENDKDPIVLAQGLVLNVPETGTDYVLTNSESTDELLTLNWNKANNGPASVSAYTIEVAKSGTNFANPITAVKSEDVAPTGTYTYTLGYLNTLVQQLAFETCGPINIDIRIKSTLGNVSDNPQAAGTTFVQYSNTVTIKVTPTIPLISFAKDGEDPATAPRLGSSSIFTNDYEGYMYLTPGAYKFYQPQVCETYSNAKVFGVNPTGGLLQDTGVSYQVAAAGYYLVRANTASDLSYSVTPITWSLFGAAKPFFPAANSPLTYDQASGVWKTTITLSKGYAFKFRSGSSAYILGKYDPAKVGVDYGGLMLSYGGGDLVVPGEKTTPRVNASFDVTLDLRSPRNYIYTITEHL